MSEMTRTSDPRRKALTVAIVAAGLLALVLPMVPVSAALNWPEPRRGGGIAVASFAWIVWLVMVGSTWNQRSRTAVVRLGWGYAALMVGSLLAFGLSIYVDTMRFEDWARLDWLYVGASAVVFIGIRSSGPTDGTTPTQVACWFVGAGGALVLIGQTVAHWNSDTWFVVDILAIVSAFAAAAVLTSQGHARVRERKTGPR